MFIAVDDTQLHVVSFGNGERTLVAVGGWAAGRCGCTSSSC
jgi:hypothetical protein